VRAGEQVGRVTDAIWSPRLEKNIGYAWVPIDLAAPGTTLEVESEQGPLTVTTATIPFLDPRKEVPAQDLRQG
jgi:aminomethyltransferase